MSIVKSLSVGDGDMFYIKHISDNFTIIDCCISDEDRELIINEIKSEKDGKTIVRFISTHPDEDHLRGLDYLDDQIKILNFYCVKNEAMKKEVTPDFEEAFKRYCELRNDSKKAFYLEKGCSRRWMNIGNEERGGAGLDILWPDVNNKKYLEELNKADSGESFNNISIILKYELQEGAKILWMGDLETDFMEKIIENIKFPNIDILFAPHHGRDTGKVPEKWLTQMNPKIIIIGEAPSEDLNYYQGYNVITQNSAHDITFDCISKKVHIHVSNNEYSVDFLDNENISSNQNYIGTLNLEI